MACPKCDDGPRPGHASKPSRRQRPPMEGWSLRNPSSSECSTTAFLPATWGGSREGHCSCWSLFTSYTSFQLLWPPPGAYEVAERRMTVEGLAGGHTHGAARSFDGTATAPEKGQLDGRRMQKMTRPKIYSTRRTSDAENDQAQNLFHQGTHHTPLALCCMPRSKHCHVLTKYKSRQVCCTTLQAHRHTDTHPHTHTQTQTERHTDTRMLKFLYILAYVLPHVSDMWHAHLRNCASPEKTFLAVHVILFMQEDDSPLRTHWASQPRGDRVVLAHPCWKWLQHLGGQKGGNEMKVEMLSKAKTLHCSTQGSPPKCTE